MKVLFLILFSGHIYHHGNCQVPLGVHVPLDTSPPTELDLSLYNIIESPREPRRFKKRKFGDLNEEFTQIRASFGKRNSSSVFGFKKGRFDLPIDDDNLDSVRRKKQKKNFINTKCMENYDVGQGEIYKFSYPSRNSFCTVIFRAKARTSINFYCKVLKMEACDVEYLYLSDGKNEGVRFCKSENFGSVTDLSLVMLQYERNRQQRYRSKLKCFAIGSVNNRPPTKPDKPKPGGGGGNGGGTGGGSGGGSGGAQGIVGDQICPKNCGRGKSFTGSNRIVGGSPATQGEYPWMVLLKFDFGSVKNRGLCGGSILNSKTIITAAHCVAQSGLTGVTAIVGEHNIKTTNEPHRQLLKASSFIIHPNYDASSKSQQNDLALISLSSHIRFSADVGTICIAPPGDYANLKSVITGWGTQKFQDSSTLVNELHEVSVRVWDHQSCKNNYNKEGYEIITKQVCASSSGKDSCQGDSGGPLVVQNGVHWYQIGVVSYGIRCAEAAYPGLYTKPVDYLSWIKEKKASGNCD